MDKEKFEITFRIVFKRQPPGDRWVYMYDGQKPEYNTGTVFPTLTAALEDFYQKTQHTRFLIDATQGIVFAVDDLEKQKPVVPELPKFSIYGER